MRFLCSAAQIVTVRQALSDGLELLVLAGDRRYRVNLNDSGTQFVGFTAAGISVARQLCKPFTRIVPCTEQVLILTGDGPNGIPRETIDGLALCGLRTQPQLIGLPVNGDKVFAEFVQRTDRCSRTADDNARTPFARYRAGDDEFAVLDVSPDSVHDCADVGRLNPPAAIDLGALCVVTDDT